MIRTLWPLAFSAVLLFGSCASGGGDGGSGGAGGTGPTPTAAADASECNIRNDLVAVNAVLSQAEQPNADMTAIATTNAARLQELAQDTGGGALNQATPRRDAACRVLSVRAYTALLYAQGVDQSATMQSLLAQVADGGRACSSITEAARNPGTEAHCAFLQDWAAAAEATTATTHLQSMIGQLAGATEQNPVPDASWVAGINDANEVARLVNAWTPIEGDTDMDNALKAQRAAQVCRFWSPIQRLNRYEGRGGPSWHTLFEVRYPEIMRRAIDTIPVTAPGTCSGECVTERRLRLSQMCRGMTPT